MQVSRGDGRAALSIAVDGKVRDAHAYVALELRAGVWRVIGLNADTLAR